MFLVNLKQLNRNYTFLAERVLEPPSITSEERHNSYVTYIQQHEKFINQAFGSIQENSQDATSVKLSIAFIQQTLERLKNPMLRSYPEAQELILDIELQLVQVNGYSDSSEF